MKPNQLPLLHSKSQYILAANDQYDGKVHDKKITDEIEIACFSPIAIRANNGFEGWQPKLAKVILPIKKRRKPKGKFKDILTNEQNLLTSL